MHSFKRTLIKALVFVLAVFLLSTLITEPYYQNETHHYQDGAVRDQLAGQLDVLICGSSHAYCGIVPVVVDERLGVNSYNISAPMMTIAGRYEMLEKELDRNPVDLVILDASFSTFNRVRSVEGPEGDIYQLGRYRNPVERMGYFLEHIRLAEYAEVFSDALNRGITAIQSLLDGEGRRGSSMHYETKGWRAMDSIPQPIANPDAYHTVVVDPVIDPDCLAYMDAMIDLCQERDIPVIVVVVPISEESTLLYANLDILNNFWKRYSEEQGVPYFDFNLYHGKVELFPDETSFYDRSHLAAEAAGSFTKLMCQVICQWEAGEDVSQYFYPSYAVSEETVLNGQDFSPKVQ